MLIHGNLAFITGQVADDISLDIKGQTRQVLSKIDRLLDRAKADKSRILWASIWIADYQDFDLVNEVWDMWTPDGEAPARACVEAKPAVEGYRVEIAVIAGI
jgi:enamine deaminase RidA (YjgF/YER057c/UK114 family)